MNGKVQKINFQLRKDDEYIQLIQLLKATNVVYNGADAQQVVVDGMVQRNGEVELRKRAKLVPGDVIEFQNYVITVTKDE